MTSHDSPLYHRPQSSHNNHNQNKQPPHNRAMAPIHHNNNHNATHADNSEPHESNSLVLKLYSQLLSNHTVQEGIKQITRLSQPIIGKFDTKVVQITDNMRRWVSPENIYNKLATVWLSLNYPYNEQVCSYETFDKKLEDVVKTGRRYHNEFMIKTFYNNASQAWVSLQEPDLDAIRNTVLHIVAKTVNKAHHFSDEAVVAALYNIITMLIEKRRELVSAETYLQLVRLTLGEDYYNSQAQEIGTAVHEYYMFAKTFLVVDFPLAVHNKDVLGMIIGFIQDNSFYYGDSILNFIEKRVDFLLKITGQDNQEYLQDHRIAEKATRIAQKIRVLTGIPVRKAENALQCVQNSKPYLAMDKYIHINNKIDYTVYLAACGYKLLKENVLEPSVNGIRVISDRVRAQVTVIIEGVNIPLLRKRYAILHARYEVLQKCAVIVADETVKLVFDKKALKELEQEGKKEVHRLYHELKGLETEKIVGVGVEYYAKILKKAKHTYNKASKIVYYHKKEIGDQDGAAAVRPQNDREVEEYDRAPMPTKEGNRVVY